MFDSDSALSTIQWRLGFNVWLEFVSWNLNLNQGNRNYINDMESWNPFQPHLERICCHWRLWEHYPKVMQKPRPSSSPSAIHVADDDGASQPPPLPLPPFPSSPISLVAVDPVMTHCQIIFGSTFAYQLVYRFLPAASAQERNPGSPEVQDYFFQLAGMNILRAARLLTLGIDTQKTAQIHLRHWTWSFADNDNQQLRMKISNPNGPNAQITKRNGWLVRGICSLEQKWWWLTD